MNDNQIKVVCRDDGSYEVNGKVIRQREDGKFECDGRLIHKYDIYKLKGRHKLKFNMISSDNNYDHGVILYLCKSFVGDIFFEGVKCEVQNIQFPSIDLFERNFGKEFILDVDLREGEIFIYNGTIARDIVRYSSGHYGMFIDEISCSKKRYQCNSPMSKDYDYDDFVFEIEVLE